MATKGKKGYEEDSVRAAELGTMRTKIGDAKERKRGGRVKGSVEG